MDRAASSDPLLAEMMAIKKVVLMERILREQEARGSNEALERALKTRLRSQVGALTTGGGLRRVTTLIDVFT